MSLAPNQEASNRCLLNSVLLSPRSRGSVGITGPTSSDPLRVDPAYLLDSQDSRLLLDAIDTSLEYLQQTCFNGVLGKLVFPINNDLETLQRYTYPNYHFSGTCPMGEDEESVVDFALRFRGLEGLRIVDASVIREPLKGNLHPTCIMLGERAADLILAE